MTELEKSEHGRNRITRAIVRQSDVESTGDSKRARPDDTPTQASKRTSELPTDMSAKSIKRAPLEKRKSETPIETLDPNFPGYRQDQIGGSSSSSIVQPNTPASVPRAQTNPNMRHSCTDQSWEPSAAGKPNRG